MLKINNTFLEYTTNKFYKILDKLDNIDYYLLVRTQDNPDSGKIQFIICKDITETEKIIEYRVKTYILEDPIYIYDFCQASELWKELIRQSKK